MTDLELFQLAHERFTYKDGRLYARYSYPRVKKGSEVGSPDGKGYRKVKLLGKNYLQHQIIFLMHYGYRPKIVDHINQIRDDNRIENLREATPSENVRNSSICKSNTGVRNISYTCVNNCWYYKLYYVVDGKQTQKYFKDLDSAIAFKN